MATQVFYRMAMMCAIIAFVLMFIAFASPFWYKSWTRVHSPFANIGLWHVCLSGWIMPRDPVMKSYVGCWWIHSTEFELVNDEIMPAWFRIIQTLCVFTVILDLVVMVLILIYLLDGPRKRVYKKDNSRIGRMFIVDSILMLVSAFCVFLISLIFAEMSNDSDWMPRPWMNYLSWSYGLCVLSGFFAAFGGMFLFILGLLFKDKHEREVDGLDSAAQLRQIQDRAREKEEEAMAPRRGPPVHVPPTRFSPPQELTATAPPPVALKSQPRVGESFV